MNKDTSAALALLGRSEAGNRDLAPRIEGKLPQGLAGALYRNGPGLFERGGLRKTHLLDGDGLLQRLTIGDGRAHYRNRFVATGKFEEEEKAGRYRHATWSTRRPGGMAANLMGGNIVSQAGVTVYAMNGRLLAFDETDPAYRLDPETLATIGPAVFGDGKGGFFLKAHAKYDPIARQWLMMGVTHGPSMTIHAIAHAADGALVSHQRVKAPRQVYLHDFFATEHYVLFLLHPLHFAPLNFLLGRKSVIESLEWRPEEGALLMVLPRAGGEPRFIEAPASFMWHSLNAYEKGTDIVADFVGYAAPDHFIGKDAQLRRIMEGMSGKAEAEGHLRRYIVTPSTGHLKEEILLPGRHEFPMHDPRAAMREHRIAYLASGGEGVLNSGTRRADLTTGRTADFDFGPTSAAGEPVFAPKPGGAPDEGWLLVQVLDGAAGQSFFAVFDAKAVDAGPIARLHLPFSLPVSFHGTWVGA